jgi:hypothetical protein
MLVSPRPAPARQRAGLLGHPAGVRQGTSQDQLYLGVETAELVRRPPGECVMHRRIHAEEKLLPFPTHE